VNGSGSAVRWNIVERCALPRPNVLVAAMNFYQANGTAVSRGHGDGTFWSASSLAYISDHSAAGLRFDRRVDEFLRVLSAPDYARFRKENRLWKFCSIYRDISPVTDL